MKNVKKKIVSKKDRLPNFQASVLYSAQIELSEAERMRIVKSVETEGSKGWDRACLSPAHRKELDSILNLRDDLFAHVSLLTGPNGPKAWLIIRRKCGVIDSLNLPIKELKALGELGEFFGLPHQIIIEKVIEYAVTLPNLKEIIEPFVEGKGPLKTAQDAPKSRGRDPDASRRAKASLQRSATALQRREGSRRTPVLSKTKV